MDAETKKMETLKFVTGLVNHLSLIGAREEMRRAGEIDILDYVKKDDHKTQLFLECVYVGERVGAGLRAEILDEETIFKEWTPRWWKALWEKLEPLIKQERKRRKDEELCSNFEWLFKHIVSKEAA